MTSMKQITKQLKKFAPEWYEELKIPLKHKQKPRNSKLDIGDGRYCIIGEVYGFLGKDEDQCRYYCDSCRSLGMRLCYASTLKRNSPLIIELISHINNSHPELIKDL